MKRDDVTARSDAIVPRQWRAPGFVAHAYERSATLPVQPSYVWAWLNTPETFTRQVWPWRVEFVQGSGVGGSSGFSEGVLNTHHGPLLRLPGVLTRVDHEARERDLHYYYGARIISFRLIRPTGLFFRVGADVDGWAVLEVRVECDVKPWVGGLWSRVQAPFWGAFFNDAAHHARALAERDRASA